MHPFTPIPLCLCAEFFSLHRDLDTSFEMQLQHVLETLRGLKRFNNLAMTFLHLFENENVDNSCQVSGSSSDP